MINTCKLNPCCGDPINCNPPQQFPEMKPPVFGRRVHEFKTNLHGEFAEPKPEPELTPKQKYEAKRAAQKAKREGERYPRHGDEDSELIMLLLERLVDSAERIADALEKPKAPKSFEISDLVVGQLYHSKNVGPAVYEGIDASNGRSACVFKLLNPTSAYTDRQFIFIEDVHSFLAQGEFKRHSNGKA